MRRRTLVISALGLAARGASAQSGKPSEASKTDPVEAIVLQYLNRLSDYFFVLARQLAQDLGADEVVWKTRA